MNAPLVLPRVRDDRPMLDTISVAMQLLRRYGRPLGHVLVRYALPPVLVGAAGTAAVSSEVGVFGQGLGDGDFDMVLLGAGYTVSMLGYFAAFVVVLAAVGAWLQHLADNVVLDAGALAEAARPHFGRMAGALLALGVVIGVAFGLFLVAVGLVVGVSAAASPVLAMFLGLLVALPLVTIGTCWLYGHVLVAGQSVVSEGKGGFQAFSRANDLLKGAGWRIAGVAFVLLIVYYVVQIALSLPFYGLLLGGVIWGSGDEVVGGARWLQGTVGFLTTVVGLVPMVWLATTGGLLYFARVEATEYVGFGREMDGLLAAFDPPADPARALPAAAWASASPPMPPPLSPEPTDGWPEARLRADLPANPVPAPAPTSPPPERAASSSDPADDAHARWRGPRGA